MGLPDVPVQCPPVLFGEEGLGQWCREVGRIFVDGVRVATRDVGREELGGRSGVEWSQPMVKLVSGMGIVGLVVGSGGGCSCC